MAEKFGIGGGPHELKIGNGFGSSSNNGKFHTIRYDFKPASVDKTKVGHVTVGESNSLTVSVPNTNGLADTTFR
jgi:ELL-associated factor